MKHVKTKKIAFYYLPLLLWSAGIFALSSVPGNGFQTYDLGMMIERKGAHIFEYAILAVLWVRVFWLRFKDEDNHSYHWAIFASFVYAVSDEIHQVFVFGRTGKISDVFIDLAGIALGVWLYSYLIKKRNHRAAVHTKRVLG
ncbi:MAG: Acetobutylicum phosphotransbutyrylase [Candidatus Moranbacteria bacterium GW2011_GWE1_49_15]|nr:MAG: Acetobutylicum phosphotransbutyrylase [Candidatus Moranbacteria bacterium GW2011_GWE2_47_10]KKW06697.1 MAG: Acetobutylicum phosphotransbutyrylase [Candidatus Moranbacteria bacterium GW2011_GWE1_49_15]HBP00747.1 hypothetical protein [Candidatus Moranbacteria bacterium]